MGPSRAELVIRGDIVVSAGAGGLEIVEALGIAGGRIVAAGPWADVSDAATAGARVLDVRPAAVIPGLHDFHIHLVGLARARRSVLLDDAADGVEVAHRLRAEAAVLPKGDWLIGRGWSEAQLATLDLIALAAALDSRPVFITSHDGHSAWASPEALRRTGLTAAAPDPAGGRLERDPDGELTGVLRETALDLVADLVPQLHGEALRPALDRTLRELARYGITGASEAGDYTAEGGIGADAALGDSYSTLTDLGDLVDGRLRLSLGIPVDAIPEAARRGLRTGDWLSGRRTLRVGWAKEYADGALGSGTAALFAPSSCGDRTTGILRVTPDELDAFFAMSRPARIGLAIHAIGDLAAATVLDALGRAPAREAGVPDDRMEHAQLLRRDDLPRFAGLGLTASIQPIHAAADRDLVEGCWGGRQEAAYAWRGLIAAGARLAAGSDAPVESVDPWLGLFAALHRRFPSDDRGDWRPMEALGLGEALGAYTRGPARAILRRDEGHLNVGARADFAVLDVGIQALRAGGEELAGARAAMTMVDGREVPMA